VVKSMNPEDQEKYRCKRPEHPTWFVNKNFKCKRAWKCKEYGMEGCVAK